MVDEDMPRSTARILRQSGYAADDVRDIGLRGHSDAAIFAAAQQRGAAIVTADKGFANLLAYPLGTHAGIVLLRVPNELPTAALNAELLRALRDLEGESLSGALVVVEGGRTRVRRPQ